MDQETSRTSSGSGDFDEDDEEDYEDNEETLDEEESFSRFEDSLDNADELRLLAEEGELSVEELRRKYMGDAPSNSSFSAVSQSAQANGISHPASDVGSTSKAGGYTSNLAPYFTEEALNDENDDEEYSPPPDPFRRVIRVGSDYQVKSLPSYRPNPYTSGGGSVSSSNGADSDEASDSGDCRAHALWIPAFEQCPLAKLEKYLFDCEKMRYETHCIEKDANGTTESSLATFPLHHRNYLTKNGGRKAQRDLSDDENALFALFKANYAVEKAKMSAPFGWPALKSVNGARLTYTEPWRHFSEEDCEKFEEGLRVYGKNFTLISANILKDRTVGELIRFYYTWKKTERHDMFVEKNKQLAPAQRIESANTTDFMGSIMDGFTGGGRSGGAGNNEGSSTVKVASHHHSTSVVARTSSYKISSDTITSSSVVSSSSSPPPSSNDWRPAGNLNSGAADHGGF